MSVVGLGYCDIDFIGVVPRIPGIDDNVRVLDAAIQGGGVAATAMVAAARLGENVKFIGCVGDDEKGQLVKAEFEKEGIDISSMITVPGLTTAFSYVLVDKPSGKRTIAFYYDPSFIGHLAKADLEPIREAKILHIDGAHEASIRAVKIAKESAVTVTCDTAGYAPEYGKILKYVDVFIPSIDFAEILTGEKDPVRAAKTLLRKGPSIVVVTLGSEGSVCVTENEVISRPAFKVKVIDTLGAGDVYHGAFVFGLLRKWPLGTIIQFSNAVSGMKCGSIGGRTGIPNLNQVEAFLREHGIQLP